MAAFRIAGGLLLALSLALLGRGAGGQGNGRDKKQVSGGATLYLGQDRDIWWPLMHTTVNLSDISSIKSSFEFRTFDPEGAIFYGDTKNGMDWFVLSLKDGIPLMQISKGDILISVTGGPKLNDGRWHTLEVSNHGKFVVLGVDGGTGLVAGMQSKEPEEPMWGELRLALGGILVDTSKMIVQFQPHMDGCLRNGNWLNLSAPWDSDVEELLPCYRDVKPGSYFPGTGLALFKTSAFPIEADKFEAEFWGDFSKMDGTIFSIRAPGQEPMLALVANNNTEEVTITFGEATVSMSGTFKRLTVITEGNSLKVLCYEDGSEKPASFLDGIRNLGYLTTWKQGHFAIGGLLGQGEDKTGSQFLTGCLEKIQIQGQDLDLDLAVRHMSISSHSCPA